MSDILPQLIHTNELSPSNAESWPDDGRGKFWWHTLLSSPKTDTNSLTMGILTCPANQGYLALHRHEQAEVYYILDGKGRMHVAEKVYEVSKGDMIYVPSNAEHGIWNVSGNINESVEGGGKESRGKSQNEGEDLRFLYVFAADSFDEIKYRFS